jgi:hypothetical protein
MAVASDNFLLARERERNHSTQGGFDRYARHRAEQHALLEGLSGERIALLGAGNCNDLELTALARAFTELHLFDIDAQALGRAFARQTGEVQRACTLHTCDLSGVASLLEGWRSAVPEPMAAQLAAWHELTPQLEHAGQFDAVLSGCLLSQLAINLRDFFGLVPALNSALLAAIAGHVMLASALTKPGGTLLVVSDCVTSRYPIHEEARARGALPAILHLAAQGAAFPGTDPALIAALMTNPDFAVPQLEHGWIWDLGPQAYLVYALQAERLAAPAALNCTG